MPIYSFKERLESALEEIKNNIEQCPVCGVDNKPVELWTDVESEETSTGRIEEYVLITCSYICKDCGKDYYYTY